MRIYKINLKEYLISQTASIEGWREKIFYFIFGSTILLGSVSLITSMIAAIQEERWLNVVIFALIYILGVAIVLQRRIPYKVRVWSGVFFFYVLGMVTFLTIGPFGSFRVWMFAFAVVASLLLGIKAGLFALGLNTFTIILTGVLMNSGFLDWGLDLGVHLDYWLTTGITFVFLNSVVTISLAVVVHSIEEILQREQRLTSDLTAANEQLEHEIVERKQVEGALKKSTYQQERLIYTARHLTDSLDLNLVLERIGRGAKEILDSFGCAIYLLDEDGEKLNPVVAIEDGFEEEILEAPIEVESSFTGQCVLARKGLIFNDAGTNPGGQYIPGTPEEDDERVIVAPFIADGEVLGAMCLNRMGSDFTREDLVLAESFATYASTALKNAQTHAKLLREIEEHEIAERALRESEERFHRVIDNSPNPIYSVDYRGIIQTWNNACQDIFQYGDEIIGESFLTLIDEDEAGGNCWSKFEQVVNGLEKVILEIAYRRKDGSVLHTISRIYPLFSAGGDGLEFVFANTDITSRKQHEREQEASVALVEALRAAQTRADMLPIILNQISGLLDAEGAAIGMVDPDTGDTRLELAHGVWRGLHGERISKGDGLSGMVISTNQPYISSDVRMDPRLVFSQELFSSPAVMGLPLIAKDETIGVLWVGRPFAFDDADLRLATTIAEMAASAIQRATLHEETQRRVQRLNILHNLDKSISTNFDLETILRLLLEQITIQLGIDAADILLYEAPTHTLIYSDGRGFRTDVLLHTALRIGTGFAGKVAYERRKILIPDISELSMDILTPPAMIDEGFVSYCGLPLIAKGVVKGVLELYHRQKFDPDQELTDFLDSLARQAAIAIDNATLFDSLQRSNLDLSLAYDTTLEGWAKALELRDKETVGHAKRVVEMTLELVRSMGMSSENLKHVRRGALLHDIGKMGIPDNILHKPGPLDDNEWAIMRQHPIYAFELLTPIKFLRLALDIPYYHHEKWDGSGYPRGLEGVRIPLAARVFAIVDVFDALLSERPYRAAWPRDKVFEYIESQKGIHFDPEVVDNFLRIFK